MNNYEIKQMPKIHSFLSKNFVCETCCSHQYTLCFEDAMGYTYQRLFCKKCNHLQFEGKIIPWVKEQNSWKVKSSKIFSGIKNFLKRMIHD